MSNIVSRQYSPKDFSAGQIHEMLVTLGKYGFSPKDSDQLATNREKVKELVNILHGVGPRRTLTVRTNAHDHSVKVNMGNASGSFRSPLANRPLEVIVNESIGWAMRHCNDHGIEIAIEPE